MSIEVQDSQRYEPAVLRELAAKLLARVGLDGDHAACAAEAIVEADLLGHHSHGLVLLPRHVSDLRAGRMTARGEPDLVHASGAAILIDGRMLPGPVVVKHAIDYGLSMLHERGTATLVVRNSHHLLALAAYLERVARKGVMMIIASSNPWAAFVAPHGGCEPVYSPNPVACAIPTDGDPILVDISLSSVAVNASLQRHRQGERLHGRYLLDAKGAPTDDPAVLFEAPTGSILPLGGVDLGYKGFALGLMVEALTSGLAGAGRAEAPTESSNTAFIMLIDPDAFGGASAFCRETGWLARSCLGATPVGDAPVRLPGQRALELKRDAMARGCSVPDSLMQELVRLGAGYDIPPPHALADPRS